MAKLIYCALTSLDGYVADEDGKFDWSEPDEEVHAFAWETIHLADQPVFIQDYAVIWRGSEKVVYSKTLEKAASARTRIEREFDPEASCS
jgi:hypothetical protein